MKSNCLWVCVCVCRYAKLAFALKAEEIKKKTSQERIAKIRDLSQNVPGSIPTDLMSDFSFGATPVDTPRTPATGRTPR